MDHGNSKEPKEKQNTPKRVETRFKTRQLQQIGNTFRFIVFKSPCDVTEHRHEDNSSVELFGFAHFNHELSDFTEKLQCSVDPGKYFTRIPLVVRRLACYRGLS